MKILLTALVAMVAFAADQPKQPTPTTVVTPAPSAPTPITDQERIDIRTLESSANRLDAIILQGALAQEQIVKVREALQKLYARATASCKAPEKWNNNNLKCE